MIESIAVTFSLLSVYFTVKNKIIAWPFGIVGILFYALYYYNIGVIGNTFLQFPFLIQSIYGWYNWKNINKKITKIGYSNAINYSFYTVLSFLLLYSMFIYADDNYPFFDSLTTSLSLMAMTLLAYRKLESWYYWITVDILYVIFFIYIDSYLSAITYFIFLILAIIGLKKWSIEIKKH